MISPFHAVILQQNQPTYATLGPEAPAILRPLIGDSHVSPIQPGELAFLIKTRPIHALIVPDNWADTGDRDAARAAGLPVYMVQRHTSVNNILANIASLAKLTDTQLLGEQWITSIQTGLTQIQAMHRQAPPTRVLILTPEAYTQGQGTLITELIGIAGGINVAAEAGIPEARQIEDAQIRALTPDVVLLIGWTADTATAFLNNPLYRGVAAFDRQRVYQIASPGKDPARLVEDVQRLADLFHPPVL
ncbi:MAG: ABC transporter substrate-binding protein [Anaerolineae bacterium]|nr:ABC transporter substrate-binding protein [Anaerolineae bacterium]